MRGRNLCSVSLWAWLLYFVSSLGYFLADGLSASTSELNPMYYDIIYTVLAGITTLDALLYLEQWRLDADRPIRLDEAAWGNFINVFASLVLVLSACLYFFFPASDSAGKLAQSHASVQAALNLMSIVLFLIAALLYNSEYYNNRELAKSKLYFWAELMNALPSLGYTGTAGVQLFSALLMGPSTPAKAHRQLLSTLAAFNLAFDAMFCVDALLCAGAWYSETVAERRESVHEEVWRS